MPPFLVRVSPGAPSWDIARFRAWTVPGQHEGPQTPTVRAGGDAPENGRGGAERRARRQGSRPRPASLAWQPVGPRGPSGAQVRPEERGGDESRRDVLWEPQPLLVLMATTFVTVADAGGKNKDTPAARTRASLRREQGGPGDKSVDTPAARTGSSRRKGQGHSGGQGKVVMSSSGLAGGAHFLATLPPSAHGLTRAPLQPAGLSSGWGVAVVQLAKEPVLSPVRGPTFPGHLPFPLPRTPLVASPVIRTTAPPSTGPQSVPQATSGPDTELATRVRAGDCVSSAPPVSDTLLGDNSSTMGPEGEAWVEGLVGRLPGTTRKTTLSVLLVSLVDLLGSWSSNFVTWSEGHRVFDVASLTEVMNGCVQPGVKSRLWCLLQLQQSRQEGHLPRSEPGNDWQYGGGDQGERRDNPAGGGGS